MKIEHEKKEISSLELNLESLIQSFTHLSQAICEGDVQNTEQFSLKLKRNIKDMNVTIKGLDLLDTTQEELDKDLEYYEQKNEEISMKLQDMQSKTKEAKKVLEGLSDINSMS